MKSLFVPYELALKLKEKGFDEPCLKVYQYCNLIDGPEKDLSSQKTVNEIYDGVLAPLYQQVIDWFREKCNIHIGVICIRFNSPKIKGYQYQLVCDNYTNEKQIGDFKDYYEALNKAIDEALKLI